MTEEWKKINGFEYYISNKGKVKNSDGYIKKLSTDKDGYKTVTLWSNGKSYFKRINRLVAEAFIPNPCNLPVVNHKNEIKSDNNVQNLEWCTTKYNNEYSKCRKVIQLDFNGKIVNKWSSIKNAADSLNLSSSHIFDCCSKKEHCHTYGGFQWIYDDNYDENNNYAITPIQKNRNRPILQFDANGVFIREYKNIRDIPNVTRSDKSTIAKICNNQGRNKTCKGFIYKWK